MTVATVTTAVRRLVQDEPWEDYLSSSYTLGGQYISLLKPTAWEEGDIMDLPDTGEQFRVIDTPTSNPVFIRYAHNDTTNAGHDQGSVVLKNPRYGTEEIAGAISHVVDNWLFPDLFVAREEVLIPQSDTVVYALPADFEDVIAIVQTLPGDVDDVTYVNQFRVLPPVDTLHAPSRKALRIARWEDPTSTAMLVYAARPTTATMTSDMEPIIALGAGSFLLKSEALEKADRSPDDEDRPFRALRTSQALEKAFLEEKRRLRTRLLAQYGSPARRFIR